MRLASLFLLTAALLPAACSDGDKGRTPGQTTFLSAPMARNGGGLANGGGDSGAGGTTPTAGAPSNPGATPRTVQETDLYRLEGNRLYYLNGYRGLMVFDVTDVDQPKLLGRSPIFGSPVDMIVRNGVATVVVADWYGALDDGEPFYGSIVRGLDASDPTNIRVLGEAKLGGWVRDDRVVGDVIYAVSEDYGYGYGWGWGYYDNGTSSNTESVIVSSVNFANKQVSAVGNTRFDGYAGVFNVTPNSILLAHQTGTYDSNTSELVYLDISDPAGAIVQRGVLPVTGTVQGWGADNGRWNLDFADGKTAHVIGQHYNYGTGAQGYTLSTADFTNPDAPTLASALDIQSPGWSVTARFDAGRMYLSPQDGWYDGTDSTPFQVYDLTNSAAPFMAGTIQLSGEIWNILPAPQSRIFALGEDYADNTGNVSLQYLDVTNPAAPRLLGTSEFGSGWAWTPAAGTFKAFTMDATKGLVVLPFSGWDYTNDKYNNGLQLIEFTPTTETTAGAAQTRGWVERGIFVGNRLVSLSDLALSVVDYTNPATPTVVTELTLARNVITAQPTGTAIAEISSDWWDNDVTSSQVRVLPLAQAEETTDTAAVPTLTVDGIGAQVFTYHQYAYIVTSVRTSTPCDGSGGYGCYQRAQQVQVVDLGNGAATLLGKITLPVDPWSYWGWGWGGCFWFDWWNGGDVVQVDDTALAFRRWEPVYDSAGNYVDTNSKLYVVDVSNPNAPSLASTTIVNDGNAWWGNMKVVGDTLYTTHYEWIDSPSDTNGWVKYYVDRIDLTDRSHPVVGTKVNVPGLLVGGDDADPSTIYTIDYRWEDGNDIAVNDFDVLHLDGSTAELRSRTELDGWVGNTFVVGKTAYMSSEIYSWNNPSQTQPVISLHAIDVSDPSHPVDRVASEASHGWGWLLQVQGDRALVTSGWSGGGLDIYRLHPDHAPTFEQTVRTRGWWINGVSRQGNDLYLSSGYWGVQKVHLQ